MTDSILEESSQPLEGTPGVDEFCIAGHTFQSRLILGSGKYDSFEVMRESFEVAETQCVTIAVRRERLHDSSGRNILDFVDPRLILLPNTAGCYDAETAVRCAKMGREILRGLENPGADWVKLEVLGDSRSLGVVVVTTIVQATKARSRVTSTAPVPLAVCRSLSNSNISAWIATSNAVVGP